METLTTLSGLSARRCSCFSTTSSASSQVCNQQHLQDCTVQLLTGNNNTKAWLDHLQLALPKETLLPADADIARQGEAATAECITEPVKLPQINTDAKSKIVHVHASCQDHHQGCCKTAGVHHTSKAAHPRHSTQLTKPAAPSNRPQQCDVAAEAASPGSLLGMQSVPIQVHPTAQPVPVANAEGLATQLLENMDCLQTITLQAVQAAACADKQLAMHANGPGREANLDNHCLAPSQQQCHKRHKPLSRELKALRAEGRCLDSQHSSGVSQQIATRSSDSATASMPVETVASKRRMPAEQALHNLSSRRHDRCRSRLGKILTASWAGPNADSGDIEAIHRFRPCLLEAGCACSVVLILYPCCLQVAEKHATRFNSSKTKPYRCKRRL